MSHTREQPTIENKTRINNPCANAEAALILTALSAGYAFGKGSIIAGGISYMFFKSYKENLEKCNKQHGESKHRHP